MLNIPHKLPDARERAFLVGGSIRDMLMERPPVDYDFVVPENPESYARKLAAIHHSRVIELGKAGKRIFRVIVKGIVYDISRIKGASIKEDLAQRDFTVNALAYDPFSGDIIDVTNGRRDLARRQIRMVSPSIFDQDPIRLMRSFRMAAVLGFDIEKPTRDMIQEKRHLIRLAAGERIRDELFGILKQPSTAACLEDMAGAGLLVALFPEMEGLAELKQNQHHAFDALTHTLKTVDHLEAQLDCLDDSFPKSAEELNRILSHKRNITLKCAALLHDIGKPATASTDDQGHRHYYGHEKTGAHMADNISQRFRFSNHERESIVFIVRHHLRPLFLFNQAGGKTVRSKARVRFFLACGPLVPDIVLHAVADSRGKTAEPGQRHLNFVRFADSLLHDYFTGFRVKKEAPQLINGHDLIHVFGLSPSSVFASVLKQVEEARITGEVHNKTDALNLVDCILNNLRKTQQDVV